MKHFIVIIGFLLLGNYVFAQSVEVTGKITDVTKAFLPGVTIREKGTSKGTITDINGNYSLKVDKDSTLVFSFIGYTTQEIQVNDDPVIDVVLTENQEKLNEVIVTALGISQEKKSIGYATQEVDSKAVTSVNASNMGNMLSGQVAGLTVNTKTGMFQEPELLLRGKTPLIVIDEIPVETNFYDVSASDIENIVVLKGPTASSLYGSRGRNGAILITTKNATKEGVEVSVSNNTMVSAGYTVYPKTQTEYGNGSNGEYEFWDGQDGGVSDGDMIWGPRFSDNLKIAQWNSPIYDSETGETTEWYGDVSGTQYDDQTRYSRVPTAWEYHNNLKNFMQTSVISTTNVSIASKGQRGSTRFSASYQTEKGRVPNTSLKTGGLSFHTDYKLAKNLTFDGKLSYNKVYSPNYPRHGYGPYNHMYTILIWMGDDVNGEDMKNHLWVPGQEGYRQASWNYAWYNNPYFMAYEYKQKYDGNTINGQVKLKWDITDNLFVQGRSSGVINDVFEDRKTPKSYLYYSETTDGNYATWDNEQLNIDNDVLLSYKNELSDNFTLRANLGASMYYRSYQQEYTATDGLIVPGVYNLSNSENNVSATNELEERETRSVFGTFSADLINAFYLTVTGRNDWSSTLSAANSSYFYPSVSLSTLVSNLLPLPSAFDYLKLYGSWAVVSSDLDPYELSSYYTAEGMYNGSSRVSYPDNIVNENIEPEQSISFELGLSSVFLKNRLSFDFTYYNIIDKNQILDLKISEASGFSTRTVNGNEYTTNGFEVMLKGNPVKARNFNWNIGINWNTSVKKLTGIYGGGDSYGNYSLNERADNYYEEVWQKSADGKLIVDEETALPTTDSYDRNLGHEDPDWRFGLQNHFQFKKLSVDFDVDGVVGGLIFSKTVEKLWWGGKHPKSANKYRQQEYESGESVYVPDAVNVISGSVTYDTDGNITSDTRTYQTNTTKVSWQTWCQNYPYNAYVSQKDDKTFANVFDRSYVKLRKVSLNYDFTSLLHISAFKKIEATAYGYNLAMWKKADLIDPDFGNDDSLQDPSTRWLGLGVNLTF